MQILKINEKKTFQLIISVLFKNECNFKPTENFKFQWNVANQKRRLGANLNSIDLNNKQNQGEAE